MIAGGTDAPLKPMILSAWSTMRVLAPGNDHPEAACRPFDRQRRGLVIGEGAGFLILETLDHARARGADILAEFVGYAANSDAGHITHPDLQGVKGCISMALRSAKVERSAVGYINAHGTATAVNDSVESQAIAEAFGPEAEGVPVSSTKGVHGHAMGAAGGIEAVATVLSLLEQRVPPTANYADPDPALPKLDFVSATARKVRIETAMSNSFAFGGSNAVIVMNRA
jgi:3-oxoacyl-[acyl-carrier-protein] synthase II